MGERGPQSAGGITKDALPESQQNASGIPEGLQTLDSGQARLQELGERCCNQADCIALHGMMHASYHAELPMLVCAPVPEGMHVADLHICFARAVDIDASCLVQAMCRSYGGAHRPQPSI